MANKKPSLSRLEYREIDKKFTASIKVLSNYLHNTGPATDVFRGYKVHAGTFTDRHGRTWQVQAHAVRVKKDFIKRDEVVPIISKWAVGFRIRIIFKHIIDSIFS